MNLLIKTRFAAGCFILAAFLLSGCSGKKPGNEAFIPVSEDIAGLNFSALEIPSFQTLSLEEKQAVFFLTQAALSGDPLIYKQIHPDGYQIKLILDGIVSYTVGMDERLLRAAADYAKPFYANHGFYDMTSGGKFIPQNIDGQRMKLIAMVALSNGAKIGFTAHKILIELFTELDPVIFDPQYEAVISGERQRPQTFPPASSEIFAGNDTLPAGAHSLEAVKIVDNLRAAEPFCPPGYRETLELLAKYWETGNDSLYRQYFTKNCSEKSTINCLMGFLPAQIGGEIYEDSLFQAYVYISDDTHQPEVEKALNDFLTVENMSGAAANGIMTGRIAIQAAEVIAASGFAGYRIPTAIALTNPELKSTKIILFTNVISSLHADKKLALKVNDELIPILQQLNDQIAAGHRFAAVTLKSQAFITPVPRLESTKMGKVVNVVLDYPQSVIDYAIKTGEISRALEARTDEVVTN